MPRFSSLAEQSNKAGGLGEQKSRASTVCRVFSWRDIHSDLLPLGDTDSVMSRETKEREEEDEKPLVVSPVGNQAHEVCLACRAISLPC